MTSTWAIGPSYGELKASGRLEIVVNDLVFAAGPNVGKNTVAAMQSGIFFGYVALVEGIIDLPDRMPEAAR